MGSESQASEMGGSACEEIPGAEAREAHEADAQLPDAQLPETASPKDAITVHACCICWQL